MADVQDADTDGVGFWICSRKGLVVAFAVAVESALEAYTPDEALRRRNKDTARGSTFIENAILRLQSVAVSDM
jgi:hypothetical protein